MDKENMKMQVDYADKVKTNILGFDNLLFGGLDFAPEHVVVAIKSDEPILGTLLGLQMLYGVTQSLQRLYNERKIGIDRSRMEEDECLSYFISTFSNEVAEKKGEFMNDLLLDTVIASCIQIMTNQYVSRPKPDDGGLPKIGNYFSQFFFDMRGGLGLSSDKVSGSFMHDSLQNDTDALICEEAISYSNRTNSLHLRTIASATPGNTSEQDEREPLFKRLYERYGQYLSKEKEAQRRQLEKKLDYPLVGLEFRNCPGMHASYTEVECIANEILEETRKYIEDEGKSSGIDGSAKMEINKGSSLPMLAIDFQGGEHLQEVLRDDNYDGMCRLIDTLRNRFKLIILMVPLSYHFPTERADMVIELRNTWDKNNDDYLLRKACITFSRRQSRALGWHCFKYRDFGLEFFPSLHTYFYVRRYLQRAMVYTHSNVVSDTYQQYLNRIEREGEIGGTTGIPRASDYDFENYMQSRVATAADNVASLYTDYSIDYSAVDVLEQILFPPSKELYGKRDKVLDYSGSMTAIIGDGNTYKRFITFGSIFSSSLQKEHTLIVLLNKDPDTTRRRLSCPARARRGKDCEHCHECYKYIHFMDICMGNITPDEFIYYLKLQLETEYDDGKHIRRVVIDDLQIVDYCFPYLKSNNLFLSALVSLCKEKGIYSYILCDKAGNKAGELRAVADNIICTGRDKKGKLQIFIERFIGFNNTPSKIYCGNVEKAKELFECYYKMDNTGRKRWLYRLNSIQIDDDHVASMNEYWKQ